MSACPVCAIEERALDPVAAMAMGVALGVSRGDMHEVTCTCCPAHRARYFVGMVHAACSSSEAPAAPVRTAAEERAAIVSWMQTYARKDIATEMKFAANGAYVSSSEAWNWRAGIESAARAVAAGDHWPPAEDAGAGEEKL